MVRRAKPRTLVARDVMPDRIRLDMRVHPFVREYIIDAATVAFESISAFVIRAAVERAHSVLKDADRYDKAIDEVRRMPYSKL